MLTTPVIHPGVLAALARAGHKSTVLVADANFAAATTTGPNASVVHLGLVPGTPTVPLVLDALLQVVAVEHAIQIRPATDALPSEVQDAVARRLHPVPVDLVDRTAFYDLTRSPDLALCVTTGDTARFGNVLVRLAPPPGPALRTP